MSEQQTNEEAAFLAGFSGESGNEAPAEKAEVKSEPEAKTEETKPEQEQPATEEEKPQSEPARIAGFTEDELRNLLARAAKVDELEQLVRKAHGKIGELNGKLQEQVKAPVQEKKAPESSNIDLSHVEEDYPDIAAWVRSQLGSKEPAKDEQIEQPQQPQPTQAEAASQELVELALMDRLHKGWREKVQSQDFQLWLAASGDDVRNKYQTAATADELGSIVQGFDTWQESKGARGKAANQRLEQAMTPSGSAGKPKVAPTAEDAFVSGFKSVFAR